MKKTLIFLFAIHNLSLFAQDVAVNVQYPSTVNAGQQFSVAWTVNVEEGEFRPPALSPFDVLFGPVTSFRRGTRVINGRYTQVVSYTYTYYLRASQAGKFVIPPAIFSLNNRTYSSDSLRIDVVGGNVTTANNRQTDLGEEYFIRVILDKNEVFIGEPVIASIKIFTRINSAIVSEKYPQFDGFLQTDIGVSREIAGINQENIGGTIYRTHIKKQFLLYPQKTGELVIDPMQITYVVQMRTTQPNRPNTYAPIRAVESLPVLVKVNPLPGNQPPDYSGIVGKLNIESSINRDTVSVNEAINFRITISGSGNFKLVTAPKLQLSPNIEVFDPKTTDNIRSIIGAYSSKNFEYILIPRHNDDFTIPPVTYSYFNASTKQFEQLQTPEHRFHVRGGSDSNSDITVLGGASRTDVNFARDIRFIKTDIDKLTKTEHNFILNRTYQSFYIFTTMAFLGVLFIRREHIKRNSDISKVRNRKAGKVAVKRLNNADMCLKNNQFDKFYEEVLKALWGYFSDKLNIPQADLTKTKITTALYDKKIDENIIEKLNEILDRCEYARFAPSSSGTEAESLYEGASQIIKYVENTIL